MEGTVETVVAEAPVVLEVTPMFNMFTESLGVDEVKSLDWFGTSAENYSEISQY